MIKIFTVCLVLLFGAVGTLAQDHSRPPSTPTPTPIPTPTLLSPAIPDGWVTFNSQPGLVSVLLPYIPEEQVETKNDPNAGPYTNHLLIVRSTPTVYLLGWTDYDPKFNFNRQAELEANRDNFVKGVGATLIKSQTLTLAGYQALEFSAEKPQLIYRARVYLVGRRPYLFVAVTRKGVDDASNIRSFFGSIRLGPN